MIEEAIIDYCEWCADAQDIVRFRCKHNQCEFYYFLKKRRKSGMPVAVYRHCYECSGGYNGSCQNTTCMLYKFREGDPK